MSLSFPLAADAFADLLKVVAVSWRLSDNQEYSGLASGEILAANLGPRLWTADIETKPYRFRDALDRQSIIDALDGSLNTFYLYDPRTACPRSDPGGAILGASTPIIDTLDANNKAMQISGLPAAYKLSRGDMLAFDYGTPSRRALHRIVEDATADGSGLTPLFEVRPHLRTGTATSAPITLLKPAAKMRMVPGSLSMDGGTLVSLKFQAIQTLQAD